MDVQLFAVGDVRPPQQGMDPQQQFIQVDRFDQVIIDVETKTADLGLNVIPGADEEQRDVLSMRRMLSANS